MAGNRKKAEALCLEFIQKMDPSGINKKIYEDMVFKNMSDADFEKFLMDPKRHMVMYAPNYSKVKLDLKRNIAIGRQLGREYFERIWTRGKDGLPDTLSPVKFFVIPTIVRRQAQLVTKGVSVPKDMKTINALTGQPTGDSQSAKISIPELNLAASMNLKSSMRELMGPRGGDTKAYAALQGMLVSLGRASLQNVQQFGEGAEVNKYVRSLFRGAHIDINL